jgi:hypothetical protein
MRTVEWCIGCRDQRKNVDLALKKPNLRDSKPITNEGEKPANMEEEEIGVVEKPRP